MKAIRIPTNEELCRILNGDQRVINLPHRETIPQPRWVCLVNQDDQGIGIVRVESLTESIYADMPWMAADWLWLVDLPRYFAEPLAHAGSRDHHVFDLATDTATLEAATINSLTPTDYHEKQRQQAIAHQISQARQRGQNIPDSFDGYRPPR